MDSHEQALDRGEHDGHQLAGPPGAAPARLHRQEQERHEEHREKDPVSANSHRSVTLTADRSCKAGPRPAFRRGSPPS